MVLQWLVEQRADSSTPLWTSCPVEVADYIVWEEGKFQFPPKKVPERAVANNVPSRRDDIPKSNQLHHLLNPRDGLEGISLIKWPIDFLDMVSGILPESLRPKKVEEKAAPVRSPAARKEMLKRLTKLTAVNKVQALHESVKELSPLLDEDSCHSVGNNSASQHADNPSIKQTDNTPVPIRRLSSAEDGLTDSSAGHSTPGASNMSTNNLLREKLTTAPTSARTGFQKPSNKSKRSVIEDQLAALKRRQDNRKKTLDGLINKLAVLEEQLSEYALVGKQEESVMLKGIEDIAKKIIAKLSGDEKRLFRSFLRHDTSAVGFITFPELQKVITHADPQTYDDSTAGTLQQFLDTDIASDYPPEGSEITFFDLCNIWSGWAAIKLANGKSSIISRLPTVDNGVKDFMTGLKHKIDSARERKSILGNTKEVLDLVCITAGLVVTLSTRTTSEVDCCSESDTASEREARIAGAVENDIAESLLATERSYLSILHRALSNSKAERHERRLAREAAGRKELQNSTKWADDPKLEVVTLLFRQFSEERETYERINVNDLGEFASLLDINVTYEQLVATQEVYGDKLDITSVLTWYELIVNNKL